MTRTEAIATIIKTLEAGAADVELEVFAEQLSERATNQPVSVGDVVRAFATDSVLPRVLSARELELIEQSKEDFKAGRTYSLPEARAITDAYLAPLGALKSTT